MTDSPDPKHTYLPQRIVGGAFRREWFELSSRDKQETIPWEKIRLLCLGIVEEPHLEAPTNFYLQMKDALKNLFSSEKENEAQRVREILFLELFIADQDQPVRFESTSINYRNFIGEVEYISENNFRKFLKRLVERIPDCVLDESVHASLAGRRADIRRYGNIYEFQRECQERWQKQREVESKDDGTV